MEVLQVIYNKLFRFLLICSYKECFVRNLGIHLETEPSGLQISYLLLPVPSEFMTHVAIWQINLLYLNFILKRMTKQIYIDESIILNVYITIVLS